MAQAEDTELRDLVVDALEKNGSLAKIRALLRANIFLAFEDECENLKQNESLDKILLLPEGKLCLSIIHEFLDFCNLKNTLFVYKSETRQGREYTYDGENTVADKLNLKKEKEKEPLLLTLIKNIIKSSQRTYNQNDKYNLKRHIRTKNNYIDGQNSTYIVHEDSSTTTSNSQSENSSDEKNKLDLRLTLDNSDTDTSSESTRGKTSSEYIVNKQKNDNKTSEQNILLSQPNQQSDMTNLSYTKNNISDNFVYDLKVFNNSSTDSTSYVELQPFNPADTVLLNTTGLPLADDKVDSKKISPQNSISNSKLESLSLTQTINNDSDLKKDPGSSRHNSKSGSKTSPVDAEVTEYSYDFTSPPVSGRKDTSEKLAQTPRSLQEDYSINKSKTSNETNMQNSLSSQSSVSISEVADLISEKSSNKYSNISSNRNLSSLKSNKSFKDQVKNVSDDSGDFSESPIPSLSNLSLDIHSD